MTLVFAAVLLLACSTHASGSGRRLSDGDGVVASDKQLPPVRQSVKTLGPALGAYSFMAALMDGNETWCGGTLIRSKAVLTAAHCLDNEDGTYWRPSSVRIGWADLRYRQTGDEQISVKRIIVHPSYKRAPEVTEYGSDFAILVLERRSKKRPITLSRPGSKLKAGAWVWAAGYSNMGKKYGTTANWFWTQVNSPKTCVRKYREIAGGKLRESTRTICTGGQNGRHEGVCSGDSGGPLIYGDDPGPYIQVGVLSWGLGPSPCAPGAVGVNWWASLLYPPHRKWLARKLKKLG
ncbi:hypothetical protein CHLNCDRAFT_54226 [Chlorella variabilis]|uniref:Peptidase S1 domain-containing protein n=1 Tax=Chlorella variabilis TaxID=554065 RepID=E1ZN26_CHLVA|nr:hypothetical protein CHLNCDRAFT_54226 [Chlorella variabilis]EFN52899.1 hypothetical protein CHLNCDRAFT_54226 [Chlorella variabilis]|eukprot:XP_005845001.1 hypothetical protein CHLNCDRAFT_54226 [Chlorella variabilis]